MAKANWQVLNDRYELLEELGEGGTASVYKARDLVLGRQVAIKVFHAVYLKDPSWLQRFKREARILCQLQHRHMLGIYALELNSQDEPFLVVEYLEGSTLRKRMQLPDRLSWRQSLKIVTQICEAMQFAHSNGIIHRDLKPENIFLMAVPESDYVKVLDFGLAKSSDKIKETLSGVTLPGELVGTAGYMAPEIIGTQPIDERSDIYSLGCIAYEMLSGKPVFEADNAIGLVYKHGHDTPVAVSERSNNALPGELDQIIKKCLAKNPAQRFQSMAELKNSIDELLEANSESIEELGSSKGCLQGKKHSGRWARAALLGLLVLLTGAFFLNSKELYLEFWLYRNISLFLPARERKDWTGSLIVRFLDQDKSQTAQEVYSFQLARWPPRYWDMSLFQEQLRIAEYDSEHGLREAAKDEIERLITLSRKLYWASAPKNSKLIIEYARVLRRCMTICLSARELVPSLKMDPEAQPDLELVDRNLAAELELSRFRVYDVCLGLSHDETSNSLLNLSRILLRAKRFDEAILWTQKLQGPWCNDPDHFADVRLLQGDILFEKKDYPDAAKKYQEACERLVEFNTARMVKRRIESAWKNCLCHAALHERKLPVKDFAKLLDFKLVMAPASYFQSQTELGVLVEVIDFLQNMDKADVRFTTGQKQDLDKTISSLRKMAVNKQNSLEEARQAEGRSGEQKQVPEHFLQVNSWLRFGKAVSNRAKH